MEELLNKSVEEFEKEFDYFFIIPREKNDVLAWHKSQMELAYRLGKEEGKQLEIKLG